MNRTIKTTILIVVCAVMIISFHRSVPACQVDEFYHTKEGALAASTPETLNVANKLDREDNKEKLGALVKSGTVLRLADNVKIQVLERSFGFKMLKIKFSDKREPYWVQEGSLKQINCNDGVDR